MDTLQAIIEHGISVRQIPFKIVETWSKGYITNNPRAVCTVIVKDGREWVRVERVPDYAGYWMTQICKDTNSSMKWYTKRHNLAPTLEQSVALLLSNHKPA